MTSYELMEPLIIEPDVFADDRGQLFEAYHQERFDAMLGEPVRFVQDNHSKSLRRVLRGLHYQLPPAAQGKLVRVVTGRIFDVVVDIRRSSTGFGSWQGYELSGENLHQLWVPPGFAHGFLALSEVAEVIYKLTDYHAPTLERALAWNDPEVGIRWPMEEPASPLVSERDRAAPTLAEAEVFE